MNRSQLEQRREDIWQQAYTIVDGACHPPRYLTSAEARQYSHLVAEYDRLTAQLQPSLTPAQARAQLMQHRYSKGTPERRQAEIEAKKYPRAR